MEIAKLIDHTALKPNTTKEQIVKLCAEAKQYGFASVCVNPVWVKLASGLLKGSEVAVCTVIGFPLGANTPATKAFETDDAIKNGATEVDMVINIAALKDGDLDVVEADIRAVVEASHGRAVTKVIIETVFLTDAEKEAVCRVAMVAGADFVKTSTGFAGGGATATDITLMRGVVGAKKGVKASGGVRSLADAKSLVAAGANRLGASAGVEIVKGLKGADGY